MSAISEERWQLAQKCEADYWRAEERNPDKLQRDIEDGHHFTAGVLDIRPDTVAGRSILDIAGGPYPLGKPLPHLGSYTVLDPGDYPERPFVKRIRCCAEDYADTFDDDDVVGVDEVWGYNVLQHVKDPSVVMRVARKVAQLRIRWFDVVDTPIYPVHPHSISADWLRAEMSKDGWRIVRDIDGSRLVEGARQKFVALVAERGG